MLGIFMFVLAAALSADAQSWSVGNGNVTYQVLFSKWQNPDGKTWTGSRCDQIGSKCDTRFVCNVEPVSCSQFETRGYKLVKSWPGPVEPKSWRIVGQNKYEENSLREFAYLNLTGAVGRDFCKAIMRCQVVDVDPLSNDLIDEKIVILPGLQEINLPRYEVDSRFGVPIEAESVSTAVPNYARKAGTLDVNSVQQHRFEVRVRAWGVDSSLGRRLSGGSVGSGSSLGSGSSGYPPLSSSSSSHNRGHPGFDYATPYQSPASGRYNSSYPRQSSIGGNSGGIGFGSGLGSGAFNNTPDNRYYGGNSQTYSQVVNSAGRQPDINKDDMFRRRMNSNS